MAKLTKFRVTAYKSIKDSGEIAIENGLSILAGKNESGKTSLLESLRDFDTDREINEEAYPINSEDDGISPTIEVTLRFTPKEIGKINEKISKDLDITKGLEISIRKNAPNDYFISSMHLEKYRDEGIRTKKKYYKKLRVLEKQIRTLTEDEDYNFVSEDLDFQSHLDEYIGKINSLPIDSSDKEKFIERVKKIPEEFLEELVDYMAIHDEAIEELKRYIPHFVFFDTAEDQKIPNEIPFEELDKNNFVKDLVEISDLDIGMIRDKSKNREQKKHETELNIRLIKSYGEFWTQDLTNLEVSWRDDKLFFWVMEDGEPYPPKMRSKGKQWHIAFYVKIGARFKEDKPNFLLIDEPGLFLHSKAQKDILKQMQKSSEEMQIIYSTHSPYLIDPKNLQNIRLVEKDKKNGTKAFKITTKTNCQDTLTPILTAIGEDQTLGIRTDKANSIVTEGFTDFLWTKAFRKLLGEEEINLIPARGGDSPVNIGSILFGWGLDAIYILDNDSAGNINEKKLEKKVGVDKKRIIRVPWDKHGEIEDLFSEKDKGKYFNLKNGSKTILAIKFLQEIEDGTVTLNDLGEDTIRNFEELFKKIKELL